MFVSGAFELRIRALIQADKLGNGAISAATVGELAAMLAEPEPDADVLAERSACLAVMQAVHDRMDGAFDGDGDGRAALETRRLGLAIEGVRLGLHRTAGDPL